MTTEDKKTKILIVEDEATISKAYADELRDEGFLVLVAKDGRDGLDLALLGPTQSTPHHGKP